MRRSPYDNYYNRSRTRQSLRPQNDEVVQSGAIPTRRGMDGRVTDAIDPTKPKTGGMTHRDMRGNIIQPRVPEWKTPVNQPVQTIATQPQSPQATTTQVKAPEAPAPTAAPPPTGPKQSFADQEKAAQARSAASGAFGATAQAKAQNLAGRQALFNDMKKVGGGNITTEMETRAKSLGVNPTRFRATASQMNPAPASIARQTPVDTTDRPGTPPASIAAVPATSVKQPMAKQAAIAKQDQETAGMVAQAKALRELSTGMRSWRQSNPTAPAAPAQPTTPSIASAVLPKNPAAGSLSPLPPKRPGQMSWKPNTAAQAPPTKPIDFTGPKPPSNPQPIGATTMPQTTAGRSPGQSRYRRGETTQQPTPAVIQAREHSARIAAETAKSNAEFKASAGRAWSAVKNTLIGDGETAARAKQEAIRKNEAAAARAKASQMRATQGRGY